MPIRNYNNNDKKPTVNVYSSVTFTNPESKIMQTRFSIEYFNKVMKINIALRNNAGSNDAYATYDTDNQISVYLSNIKAEVLRQMIVAMKNDPSIHNVCVECKNSLLKISDGSEYNTGNPCISILFADESGRDTEVIYETKSNYTGAYNYGDHKYSTKEFKSIELDTFAMCLGEYYKASSYAIAASVMEADLYRRNSLYELVKSISDKVGASPNRKFNNKTFLSGNNNKTSDLNGVPDGYEAGSFDNIASIL